ncbi:MAG: hypothetical protein HRU38_17575 [Saccharospirillaceae bacterium]|nr:hypothetical protein [Pseudomonadales bacterium]NRB80450.1 hypothetical protein [Saccharospirillaceae bacterium]
MRHLLLLSVLSVSLSSCYVEVTDDHHDNGYHHHDTTYPTSNHFATFNISSNISYEEAKRLAAYAHQLYSLSNQPHQLAFLNNSDQILDDSHLAQDLIKGDMLGITNQAIDNRSLSNTCDYGYLDITDYRQRLYDSYYSNGDLFDEFDANFSLHTSPSCQYRNYESNLSDPIFTLQGALNYDIFFKNFISIDNTTFTDELISSITGDWLVENDSIGYWDITNFSSNSDYDRFSDNIVWTEFTSNLTIHDHSRELSGEFRIKTDGYVQTQLGVIHPTSGSVIIEDNTTNNIMEVRYFDNDVNILINGELYYSFINWDEIIAEQPYFGLL